MGKLVFGGNTIQDVTLTDQGLQILCEEPYVFCHVRLEQDDFALPSLGAMTLYLVKAGPKAKLITTESQDTMANGDVFQLENVKGAKAMSGGEPLEFFLAGTRASADISVRVKRTKTGDVKMVNKPWGYEQWLTGEHPRYAFKKLFIKAGTKTSLQYHHHKRETMIFWDGQAALHYKSNPEAKIDQVKAQDVSSTPLHPGHLVDVFPKHLHRVEAVSDIHLFEVSTAHLDDVVRVSDDSNRPDGRIQTEHKSK